LLEIFLKKLSESDTKIVVVGCVNSGVYLPTEGSEIIDSKKYWNPKEQKSLLAEPV
jgi:hypothetical protein